MYWPSLSFNYDFWIVSFITVLHKTWRKTWQAYSNIINRLIQSNFFIELLNDRNRVNNFIVFKVILNAYYIKVLPGSQKEIKGSAFECDAILEYLYEYDGISKELFMKYEAVLEEISRMLFGMILE